MNIRVLLAFFLGLASLSGQAQLSASRVETPDVTELFVLYKQDATVDAATAESIVDSVSQSRRDQAASVLVSRLGNPVAARYFVKNRQSLTYRGRFAPDSPFERLQRYVLLTYQDAISAKAALGTLRLDPNVLAVSENRPVTFSVSPVDPLYAQQSPNVGDYQWALHGQGIEMQYAWDISRGHGYVGHVDAGIAVAHPDLQWAYRPQFSWDFVGSGSVDETNIRVDDASGAHFYRGHGTHTAGIIAASTSQSPTFAHYPNPPVQGGAGVCWYCSLMVAKTTGSNGRLSEEGLTTGIYLAVLSGAQVINLSLGIPQTSAPNCSLSPNNIWCQVLTWAQARDVLLVAAAGNDANLPVQFPASDYRTLAVGATQSYLGSRGTLWTEEVPQQGFSGSSTGTAMATRGVVAPGRDILSTFYPGSDWNPLSRCGDNVLGSGAGIGYGICTGTSMATPFVSGISGIMRSVNPLLSAGDIRTRILYTASNAANPDQQFGFGAPNAGLAIYSSLPDPNNTLTPLFAFWGGETVNYFYTTVPQMGSAAVEGTLPPAPNNDWEHNRYTPIGSFIWEYGVFPGTSEVARAQAWIFTTQVNPVAPATPLVPLYRLSYRCGDPLPPGVTSSCAQYPHHVDHFYSTDYGEVQNYVSNAGYKIDGIEGYVYPLDTQPSGTERLIRAYHPTFDDHAIFPESDQASMVAGGWSVNIQALGFVYKNLGSRPWY